MRTVQYIFMIASTILLSCTGEKESVKSKELVKSSIYFEAVSSENSGVDFSNDLFYQDDMNIIEYLYYYNGGGVAIGDINNDGLEDFYLTANQKPDKLYLNLGNLKFKDISTSSKMVSDSTWSSGVTIEDINNDGYLDIYVSKVGNYKGLKAHNLLYINNGDLTFSELSLEYDLDFSGLSTQASFFDYDNDGDMDMYLMNHSIHSRRSYGKTSKRYESDSLAGDRLYENLLNEGISKFVDVTKKAGIYNSQLGYGLAIKTVDINQDGFIDIYIGNDFHENDYIYINQGDKTFIESSDSYLDHSSRYTMGVDIADMNGDGLSDIFTLDMMPFDKGIFLKSGGEDSDKVSEIKKELGYQAQYARNTFQLNNDNQTFSDVALQTNTHATDWSWSVLLEDYDNDGLPDIFITNGIYKRPNDLDYIKYLSTVNFQKYNLEQQNKIARKLIDEMPATKIPNVIFKNKGNLEFEMFTAEAGLAPSYSNGAGYSDLDNDGDIDLIINNINQEASILENKNDTLSNNFISILLQGDDEFKNPTGAKVKLFVDGNEFFKELSPTRGFQSSSSHKLHFGLGDKIKIDSIQIIWLDGKTQIERNLKVNSHQIIKRNINHSNDYIVNKSHIETTEIFPFTHFENKYLDYEREPLMPEKLSTEGPALISADFNSDGRNDLFIGGAQYQAAELYLQKEDGTYQKIENIAFSKDVIHEDVDADVIDFDNDGDLDIYVLSGGNERMEGARHLEDRIYLNDGNGNFEKFDSNLITTNGGSISISDFDGDGFDDLFIGARSIPGGYGLSPDSFILKNTGNSNFEIVAKINIGMVTDSQWVDINNDEKLDLIIVGDWMPVTIMINQGDGTFVNATEQLGLENTQGMWNTVTVADLDKNGQKDIIVGNAGLNLKWKASIDRPLMIYLDDFDDNTQLDPIIFYDFFGEYVPFASKDKLVGQMPYLKKKFLNYTKFSTVKDIHDLTGKAVKDIYEVKYIHELRSMVYLNMGENFKGIPLPKEAQMSSIEDIIIEQNDDSTELIFVGNYNGYVTELGSNNAYSGGSISILGNMKFGDVKHLPLPIRLNSRKITKLDNNKYLVISNNDKSYIIENVLNQED